MVANAGYSGIADGVWWLVGTALLVVGVCSVFGIAHSANERRRRRAIREQRRIRDRDNW